MGARGPEIIISRSHPNFVRRLFEMEVSEIADRTVGDSRHRPGSRLSHEDCGLAAQTTRWTPSVPASACAVRASKNIVRELNNEKVDIFRWSADVKELVLEALKPA
jgi:N utilization substance protein A